MGVERRRAARALVQTAALWLAAACDLGSYQPEAPPGADAGTSEAASEACSGPCHGKGSSAAPPNDTLGQSDTSVPGVGAHAVHLESSEWHKQIPCETCHQVPAAIGDEGHIDSDLPAEVIPGGLMEGAAWNGQTCSNTYCHGSALSGGTATEPVWTEVDGTRSECGSCHGAPPPAPHPDNPDCGTCHQTMNPGEGMVIAYPELHIDGKVDTIESQPCDSCHGSAANPAPPVDTTGKSATSARGVGAHQAHLADSDWHMKVDCAACHRVPAGTNDLGHIDTPLPAELAFGALAGDASFDGTRCANSYCHGATLTGGAATEPTWTRVDGSQSTCTSCHGAPPPPPHPTGSNCGSCHPTMTPGGGLVIAYPELHIDGKVDVTEDQPCDSCHGSGGNRAPPVDTMGQSSTALRSVGAHRRHLDPSTWRKDIQCSECHRVPTATIEVGHVDSPLPAEVVFGALAGSASWNGTRCSNTYCHGSTLSGGASTDPTWTVVDGSQGQCGSCHGTPPPPPHPVDSNCGTCHDTMTAGGGLVITDPSRHIDGNLDVATDQACDACHGSSGNPAPPQAVGGATQTTARGVGAHRNHLRSSSWRAAIACSDCHRVPTATTSLGHMDTPLPAELTFSARAGTSTQWNGSRCANSYCHGGTLGAGGSATAPVWTQVDGTQSTCGSCHGAPPPAPHPADSDCGSCHDTMTPGGGLVIADPARHIDGNLDVTTDQACDSCHGSAGDPSPPVDTLGNTSSAARGVGAHRSHLGPSDRYKEVTCSECHRVPTGLTSVGHVDTPLPAELTFSGARASGTSWNGSSCSGSYCHGATLAAGGSATQPQWTKVDGSQATCSSCHGAPPPPPHPNDASCQNCHGQVVGAGQTITNPALHIDGALEVDSVHPPGWDAREQHGYQVDQKGVASCATASCHGTALTGGASSVSCESCHSNWQANCTFCHGGTDNATGAPPASALGLTARTARQVGAHTRHVTASTSHTAFTCASCHVAPSSALTPGHVDGDGQAELRFSSLNGAATYSATSAACSNLYCHGNGRTSNGTATWTSTTAMACSSCHGIRTAGPSLSQYHTDHHGGEKCVECHQSVVNASMAIIAPGLHVNGTRNVQFLQGGTYNPSTRQCSNLACHGTETWR